MSPDNTPQSPKKTDSLSIIPERDEPPRISRPQASASGAGVPLLLWLILGGLVLATGGLFYQNSQLSSALERQNQWLNRSADRIQVLEDELVATGRTLSKSGNTFEKRMADSEFEIRKLWDLSNKRNKVDIAANEKTIKALQKTLNSQQAALKDLRQAQADENATRKNQVQALQTEQQVFSQRVSSMVAANEVLKEEQQQLTGQLADLKKQIVKVDTKALTQLSKTLALHAERLDSIDATRRQLTGSVTRLTTDVNALQLQVKAISEPSFN